MEPIITKVKTLEHFHQIALSNQIAFVTYSLPSSKEITTMVQWKSEPIELSSLMELESKSGFVFSPFDLKSKFPIRLIQPDQIISNNNQLESFISSYLDSKPNPNPKVESSLYEASQSEYMSQVDALRSIMEKSSLDKLVLSRISIDNKPKDFNPSVFLEELKKNYPDAFVFMLYIADAGLWFGASPEPLLQISNNKVSTVSLAGTRVHKLDKNLSSWGMKELEEQEMVTRYIDDILNDFNIKSFDKQGPLTKQAGAVEHLLTRFSFDLKDLNGKILEFLIAIHPTPSVCGLPKDMAFEVIKSTEKHKREYYTGFLGPFNMNGNFDLFVNLRCMKVEQDKLAYFIGAGITSSSNSEKEWEETISKKSTLMRIIEKLNH
jgi:isochorismate synthase